MGRGIGSQENPIKNGDDKAENHLQDQDNAQNHVDFRLYLRHLFGRGIRVHHDLSVSAGVDAEPIDPFCVFEPSPSIKQLLILVVVNSFTRAKLKIR